MNKPVVIGKSRDLGCKVTKGFQNSKIMLSKKQKRKLAKNSKKNKWEKEEPQKNDRDNEETGNLPIFDVDGETFIDIEQVLNDPCYHTTSGRPVYVPGNCVPIRRFIPEEHTPEFPSWIIYGKRRTGKSFFMRWWFYHMRANYDQVFVFTETAINGFWAKHVPKQAIYPKWDEDKARELLDFQTWVIQNPKQAQQKGYTHKTATIADDVIATKVLRNAGDDGVFAALYVQGRHTKMTVGTATQKATAIPPKVRDNIDLVFVLRQESDTEAERIWKEHLSRLNRTTARELMELWTRTENYKMPNEIRYTLVIDTDPCKSYNERFFYAVAEDPGPFKLGSKVFWEEMDW